MSELKADCMTVTGLRLWQQLLLIVAQSQDQKVKQEAEVKVMASPTPYHWKQSLTGMWLVL